MKKRNKYDKFRRVFRTLKSGILLFDGSYENAYRFHMVDDSIYFNTKYKIGFISNNGNNIDWYIKQKMEEKYEN